MSALSDIAILLLRIGIGVIFIGHGMQKTFGAFGGQGVQGLVGMVQSLGFNPPIVWAWILALSELSGGIFTLLGVLPRVGAALISISMIVAIVKVHGPKGLFAAQGGFEYPFLILMVTLSLVITGAGKFSIFNKF
ncbi:MAG: DoxX family protein [Candidatus Omnitrophica bacterium]|nr:DoxX family protein [Candidatus Omnitrophota bacterium]